MRRVLFSLILAAGAFLALAIEVGASGGVNCC
jgi:hypothetical protein